MSGAVGRLTERAFSQQVCDLARLYGWLVYRTWNSIHSPAGYPDLTLVRPPRVVFAELKVGRGKLSPSQEVWRDSLLAAGQDWRLWRPEQMEEIVQELAA